MNNAGFVVLPSHAGVDEAGRGCLVGSVFAAAVILPADFEPFARDFAVSDTEDFV